MATQLQPHRIKPSLCARTDLFQAAAWSNARRVLVPAREAEPGDEVIGTIVAVEPGEAWVMCPAR